MVTFCAHSASLVLPTVLENVFRAQFASELPSFARHRTAIISRRPAYSRQFRSLSYNGFSHSQSMSSSPQPPATSQSQSKANAHQSEVSIEDLTDNVDTSNTTSTSTDLSHAPPKTSKTQKKSAEATGKNSRADNERKAAGPKPKRKKEGWQIQKDALKQKFREGWNPPKKLSPDALEGIRHLNAVAPERFTTPVLAEQFRVSPEAIRRILKSKWRASEEELEDRRKRWERRHDRIWGHLSELGLRPKTKRTEPFTDANVLYDDRRKGGK
ncbi:required for respiratory growth protein 9, mitochondrial [Aspergillus floccosus]